MQKFTKCKVFGAEIYELQSFLSVMCKARRFLHIAPADFSTWRWQFFYKVYSNERTGTRKSELILCIVTDGLIQEAEQPERKFVCRLQKSNPPQRYCFLRIYASVRVFCIKKNTATRLRRGGIGLVFTNLI